MSCSSRRGSFAPCSFAAPARLVDISLYLGSISGWSLFIQVFYTLFMYGSACHVSGAQRAQARLVWYGTSGAVFGLGLPSCILNAYEHPNDV